jgi:hypothetical protein
VGEASVSSTTDNATAPASAPDDFSIVASHSPAVIGQQVHLNLEVPDSFEAGDALEWTTEGGDHLGEGLSITHTFTTPGLLPVVVSGLPEQPDVESVVRVVNTHGDQL